MEFDPLYMIIAPYLQVVIAAAVAAILGWAATLLNSWTSIQVEAGHREALQSALTNGAMRAMEKVVLGRQIPVKSELMAMAIHYVHQSVPDALEFFNVTPERLEILLEAKFGEIGLQNLDLESKLEEGSF